MGKAKAIILLGISAVLAVLAFILVAVNWAYRYDVWFFAEVEEIRGGTLLVYAAVAGAVLWSIWRRAVPGGVRGLRASRQHEKAKATDERLKMLEGGAKPPETGDADVNQAER